MERRKSLPFFLYFFLNPLIFSSPTLSYLCPFSPPHFPPLLFQHHPSLLSFVLPPSHSLFPLLLNYPPTNSSLTFFLLLLLSLSDLSLSLSSPPPSALLSRHRLPHRRVCSVLPVCELERHSDDTHKRSLQKQTSVATSCIFITTVDTNLLLHFLFPLKVDLFPQKAAMLPFYLLTFAGEYVLPAVPVLGHEGMFLLVPVAMIHTHHSLALLFLFSLFA